MSNMFPVDLSKYCDNQLNHPTNPSFNFKDFVKYVEEIHYWIKTDVGFENVTWGPTIYFYNEQDYLMFKLKFKV